MATRLLIIHRQLVFAVTLKQALEQTGGFAVHPFTKAEAAFDFLRDHPQDIALVDFELPGRSGVRIVQQLHTLQPDITIIVTPKVPSGDMQALGIRASIGAPFTARELLPLLQDALDEAPTDAPIITTKPPVRGQMTTTSLSEPKNVKRPVGTTQNLGGSSLNQPAAEPAQTRILGTDTSDSDDQPQTKPLVNNPLMAGRPPATTKPSQTRPFIDNPAPVNPQTGRTDPVQTRRFDDDNLNELRPNTKPFWDDATDTSEKRDQFQTRNLQNAPEDDEPQARTRILPDSPTTSDVKPSSTKPLDSEDSSQTRNLGKQSRDPYGTRPLDTNAANIPNHPPEFSSLDRVLQSFGLEEPPRDEMDTPPVPTKDSDALRQFIATSTSTVDAGFFDDVLGAIEPSTAETPKKQRQVDFEGLVKSMQRDEPQRRLPDRQQQQLLDFVLTTGMDSVLKEIEKTKTGNLPALDTPPQPVANIESIPKLPRPTPPESSFKALASEEPPMPTLEENGTVSDLLVGITDTNFKDVLALLNDSNPDDLGSQASEPIKQIKSIKSDTGRFEEFLQATTVDSESFPIELKTRPDSYDFNYDFDDDDDGATVAQVVLRSTQENTSTPGEFSLDQLMTDINDRLTSFKLRVRPLPSWEIDTSAFLASTIDATETSKDAKPQIKRRLNEPSFLPEMFPLGDVIPPELPPLEASEVWTTRASEPSLESIQPIEENAETVMDAGYFDDSGANEVATKIAADMFSDMVVEESAYDESQQVVNEPDSASIPTGFIWNEAEKTVGYETNEATQESSEEFESSLEQDEFGSAVHAVADKPFEEELQNAGVTPVALEINELVLESSDDQQLIEQESLDATGITNWDTSWDQVDQSDEAIPQTLQEATSDDWALPQEPIEPVVQLTESAWDTSHEQAVSEPAAEALPEEARIAQLALNLTQVSLEVSAEGTVLTRDNQIVAIAGHLSQQDTIELGNVINNDWSTGGQGARLRFIALPSSGKEYMLYATSTEDNLVLSMIFSGATPLRVIRQQGQRLVKALSEVPDIKPVAEPSTPAPRRESQQTDEPIEAYAYVWLVRDPEQALNDAVAQSITAGLMTQLSELHWQVKELRVQNEYIYLYADVPGDAPSYSVIKELKKRTAAIASKQDITLETKSLWADSYLVLSPGRELGIEEIQEFVDFQRML